VGVALAAESRCTGLARDGAGPELGLRSTPELQFRASPDDVARACDSGGGFGAAQVGQDGEHAAVIVAGGGQVELEEDIADV
jgi:hypothetical protein